MTRESEDSGNKIRGNLALALLDKSSNNAIILP
jgi:hypothetical protein